MEDTTIEDTLKNLDNLDWLDQLVAAMSVSQQAEILAAIRQNQTEKAAQDGDPEAIIKTHLNELYGPKGARKPLIVDNSILVAGHQIGNPESHTCVYNVIQEPGSLNSEGWWQWEYPYASETYREHGTLRNKPYMKSAVTIPLTPGLEIHAIESRCSMGQHIGKSKIVYTVTPDGGIEQSAKVKFSKNMNINH